ncbi:hypothetical protein TNCV_984831 [Trichonephila clavipes]|nr:hypothetical protein TNCV_984831 [Trichonephila clavipes]
MEVSKSGEIVSTHLAKLDVPLFKIPASEKELDRIILRSKNKTGFSEEARGEKVGSGVPPPLYLSPQGQKGGEENRRLRRLRSPPNNSSGKLARPLHPRQPPSAPAIDGALLEVTGEEEMELLLNRRKFRKRCLS